MTNTITTSFLLELSGFFCSCRYINNENTMHERRVPVVTDKRIVTESQAICYLVLLLLYLACIHVILHLQRGKAMLHTFSINVPFCSLSFL